MKTYKSKSQWLWSFTKFLVWTVAVLYFTHVIYAQVIMYLLGDLSALPTLIEKTAEVFIACDVSYAIKSTIENVFKYNKRKQNNEYREENDL